MQMLIDVGAATGGDTGSLKTDTDTAGLQHYYRGLFPAAVVPLVDRCCIAWCRFTRGVYCCVRLGGWDTY